MTALALDMAGDRKPLASMQSREPHSIRFTPDEWAAICAVARSRALEPAVFVRMLTMYALSIAQAPSISEGAVGMPRQMLGDSQRTRRF